jgi:hypothetical protein
VHSISPHRHDGQRDHRAEHGDDAEQDVQPRHSLVEFEPHRLTGGEQQPRNDAADRPSQRRPPAGWMGGIDHAGDRRAGGAVVHVIEDATDVMADCTDTSAEKVNEYRFLR